MSTGGTCDSLTLFFFFVLWPVPTFFVGVEFLRIEFLEHFVVVVSWHHSKGTSQDLSRINNTFASSS